MKTLNQILEGIVVSADYKVGKTGRKYKAHRREMGNSQMTTEEADYPYVGIGKSKSIQMARDIATNNARTSMMKSIHGDSFQEKEVPKYDEDKFDLKSDDKGNYVATVRMRQKAGVSEEAEQVNELKKSTLKSYLTKAVPSHGDAAFVGRVSKDPEEKAASQQLANKRATGIVKAHMRMKEDAELDNQSSNPYQSFDNYFREDTVRDGKWVKDAPKGPNEVPSPDEGYRAPKKIKNLLVKKPETKMVDDPEDTMEETEVEKTKRQTFISSMAKKSLTKNSNILKTRTGGSLEQDVSEARGRPRKNPLPVSKTDDDEGEHYDADSGVEADQHIHVQLKKASDSEKPYEVSFRDGKKKPVPSHVAKDILNATERLKPEHRKNVHDEIQKSHSSLMAVHKLISGGK